MRSFVLTCLVIYSFNLQLKAMHGLPLVNYSYTVSATGITISAGSDSITCGFGPYWMQVQVSTSPAGFASASSSTLSAFLSSGAGGAATVNSFPWYNALLNVPNYNVGNSWPDQCVPEPYNTVFIPFSDLICSDVYYFCAREWVGGSGNNGPWTAVDSFTIPGQANTGLLFSLDAVNRTICNNGSTAITVQNINNGPIVNFTWNGSGGASGTSAGATVSPTITTTYSLIANNSAPCYFSDTITIHVISPEDPAFIPAGAVICTGDNIVFSAAAASFLSHSWNIDPLSGITINNSTANPAPDVTFNAAGNYAVTHTITSMGCSYTASTSVMVNICTFLKEESAETVTIYPNPNSTGVFYLNASNQKIKIEVFNVLGKIIFSKDDFTGTEISLEYCPGIYVFKISGKDQKPYFKKVMIE